MSAEFTDLRKIADYILKTFPATELNKVKKLPQSLFPHKHKHTGLGIKKVRENQPMQTLHELRAAQKIFADKNPWANNNVEGRTDILEDTEVLSFIAGWNRLENIFLLAKLYFLIMHLDGK